MAIDNVRLTGSAEVLIKAVQLSQSNVPNEWVVMITTAQGLVTVITSTDHIDTRQDAIRAYVIGEIGPYLIVDLPDSPIGSSSKARVLPEHLIQAKA